MSDSRLPPDNPRLIVATICMRVTARDAAGVARDLVGTPFKLTDGGGIAPLSALALGTCSAGNPADRPGPTQQAIDDPRQAGAFG